ncbi:MAG: hypothetical protein KJO62_12720 [Gammaproteobacteria bacterium]|nr:hypothetical protein [Gammaproteobacteria bacterium]NNM10447.1 hypothetical protein [Pseudomonadales bacterium]RZV51380.1 MAG: hypothetical protein EX270_10500 [Pseudomonadales bacterium]
MSTLIHKFVEDCRQGKNPRTICRVRSGWAVMGEAQFLHGYSLILPDPVVPDLNALAGNARATLLQDMATLGDALLAITDAVRINYEILGNLEPALHLHVFPRYESEPQTLKTKPVWFYDWDSAPEFDANRDAEIMNRIADYLKRAGVTV